MKLFYSWSLITVLFPAIEIERRGRGGGGGRGGGEGGGEEGGEKDRKNSAKKWYKDELMRKGQNTKEEALHHTRAETNAKKRMRSRYTSLTPLPSIL